VHYTIECNSKVRVRPGEHVEILEAFYRKYTEEIVVRRLRVEGQVYISRPFGRSLVDMMPMMPHEGNIDEVERVGDKVKLHITMRMGKQAANANLPYTFFGGY